MQYGRGIDIAAPAIVVGLANPFARGCAPRAWKLMRRKSQRERFRYQELRDSAHEDPGSSTGINQWARTTSHHLPQRQTGGVFAIRRAPPFEAVR
jgi:hypothetical protein